MKTRLETFVTDNAMDAIQAMNDLQNAGLISDNAVLLADVAEADQSRSIEFLDNQKNP